VALHQKAFQWTTYPCFYIFFPLSNLIYYIDCRAGLFGQGVCEGVHSV